MPSSPHRSPLMCPALRGKYVAYEAPTGVVLSVPAAQEHGTPGNAVQPCQSPLMHPALRGKYAAYEEPTGVALSGLVSQR
ncbi:hypothetical protein NDU88_004760 [Pleurodeles waltl]|uniref:Uncharacterized protein n=1 Tax=Pleurodeles waltl TaxID=8319 RepID=A0AAV7WWN5_PLEWA|nr:hypothetical protein NDU88_004760 [Pleurodeles waltl]